MMTYTSRSIHKFARDIAGYNIPCNYSYTSWDEAQKKIEALRLKSNKDTKSFGDFVMAIARAKHYVENQSSFTNRLASGERNNYLDAYIEKCISEVNLNYIGVTLPKKGLTNNISSTQPRSHKNQASTPPTFFEHFQKKCNEILRDSNADNFIKSKPFQRLKNYKESQLQFDYRDHSYFFGWIDLKVEKYDVLNRIINQLENAATMDEIRTLMNEFYKGNTSDSIFDPPSQPTAYQILNRGQNLTTLLFNEFIRSTTVSLIDELYQTLDRPSYQQARNR